jgi:2-oxoglutarate ferredoxin oxidoreductase subunit gamma
LFSGKVIAYAGLIDGQEVSWFPSYGPEMRGGTASCSVCISSEPIGAPQVNTPDVLVAMNLPSFTKFVETAVPNSVVVVDSTMVSVKTDRTDVNAHYIPASQLAMDNGLQGLANIVLMGKMLKETNFATKESVIAAIKKSVPVKKQDMVEKNIQALEIGLNS